MGYYDKLILTILQGNADSNIAFNDLCVLLERLGFQKRTRGSHTVFRKEGIVEKINLQRSGMLAKSYQVKQVRNILIANKLIGGTDEQV